MGLIGYVIADHAVRLLHYLCSLQPWLGRVWLNVEIENGNVSLEIVFRFQPFLSLRTTLNMADSAVTGAKRKLRPARKQVKPGDIDKSEGPQPGKEYSEYHRV